MKYKKILISICTLMLVVLLFACENNKTTTITTASFTPNDFEWLSDSKDFKGWTVTEDGKTIKAASSRVNNRIWKPVIENQKSFTVSLNIIVGKQSSAYIKVLGRIIELDARNGNGNQVYVKGLGNEDWLNATSGECSITITRKNNGDINISVKGKDNETIKNGKTGAFSDTENLEIGLYAGTAEFKNLSIVNDLLDINEYGWASDSNDFTGWTSISKNGFSVSKNNAVNHRVWKPLITNKSDFTISLDINVGLNSSVYVKVFGITIELDARHGNGNQVYVKGITNEDWLTATDRKCTITITRTNSGNLNFAIKGEGNDAIKTYEVSKKEDSENLEIGLYEGTASFDKILYLGIVEMIIQNNESTKKMYSELAKLAVTDNIKNWWYGDSTTGYIHPTHSGYKLDANESAPIWEGAMVLYNIYDLYVLTQSDYYKNYLVAEAAYYKNKYEGFASALENPAGRPGPASDDCAWAAMLYLIFYEVTNDEWFIKRCANLCINTQNRWYDEELGGIKYSDTNDSMSLYETGLTLSWIRLYEITKEKKYYNYALASYNRLHEKLYYDDGLYYCEVNKDGPRGGVFHINEAGSSSFLAGNMAMATIAAKLYKITNDNKYLERVYETNAGILKWYNVGGVLLNDRDAWTEGSYASYYASNVLTLDNTEEIRELFMNTALSIMTNARTDDGRYGGTWQGPAEGSGSRWYSGGSVPQQIMTSGSSVAFVTAAAILEAEIKDFTR